MFLRITNLTLRKLPHQAKLLISPTSSCKCFISLLLNGTVSITYHTRPLGEEGPDIDDIIIDESEEAWNPPIPRIYLCREGPADGCILRPRLERRIQVTEDLVAFAGLCEPPRRGKRVNRDDNDDGKDTKEEGPLWLMHICLNVRQMYKNMAE
ncbi:hypothetical protein V8E54_007210 [Elaphomyces granulatus]